MLTVALKDYHMLIGEFLLKQIQQIRARNLKSKYPFFQGRIWPKIWPTSFWEFLKVYNKKSYNDSDEVDLALK